MRKYDFTLRDEGASGIEVVADKQSADELEDGIGVFVALKLNDYKSTKLTNKNT